MQACSSSILLTEILLRFIPDTPFLTLKGPHFPGNSLNLSLLAQALPHLTLGIFIFGLSQLHWHEHIIPVV